MSVRDEVEVCVAGFCEALTQRDADAAASCFHEDATVLAPGVPVVHGANAVRGYCADIIAAGVSSPMMRTDEVSELGDGAVSEYGHYEMDIRPPGAEPFADHGKYMIVYRRDDQGRLRIWLDTFHSDRLHED
jgi:ketosteroid isomerase-like protein